MKKKMFTRLTALCFALVMALSFVLVGCGKDDPEPTPSPSPEPTTYTVTVVGGTGGGEFEEGENCTLTATVPEGKVFVRWTVDGQQVSTDNPYTFAVTKDVTVTAEFSEVTPEPVTYTVTVVGGTIVGGTSTTGEYEKGTQVTVVAADPEHGKEFYAWKVGEEEVSITSRYTFTVEKDVTLTATYYIPVTPGDAVSLKKSEGGNPIGGFGIGDSTYDDSWTTDSEPWQKGDAEYADVITYGGDPAVMVVEKDRVETAYLYVGHDITEDAVTSTYTMPEWICYSSTDLKNWTTEGIIMDIEDIPWARGQATGSVEPSAWASQVIEYKGYYWFLFCSWSENEVRYTTAGNNGHMCIGLAVSDDPTGPFECYNEPLVYSNWTNTTELGKSAADAGWNDIDPTAWVTDEGEMYVAWGNSNSFMCQVEMVNTTDNGTSYGVELEIVDQSESTDGNIVTTNDPAFYWFDELGDDIENTADIMRIDLYTKNTADNTFTEAPYLYRRATKTGYRYYMFYAAGWREALAYSYIDVTDEDGLWEDEWNYGNRLMDPTATSNTNHPAVFDFGGSTYMIYHNGSLPYGLGYRRVACIAELEFSENGFIEFVHENSTGISGVNSKITQNDVPIGHLYTVNPHSDAYYPMALPTFYKPANMFENEEDALWEIEAAKYVPENADADNYISIQAYNMAGLYLCYDIETGKVIITQDSHVLGSEEAVAQQMRMSFKTVEGENGVGVMFQCAADEDYYLAIVGGELVVSDRVTATQCTFRVQTETSNRSGQYQYNEGAAA